MTIARRVDPEQCLLYCKNVMQPLQEERMPAIAKITAKGQTTIPQEIRAALKVAPGDLIAWEVGPDGAATVRRVQPIDLEYLRALEATLSEWASAADDEAYRGL
jgi:bifunctional DNA-binding transcriptional regulator/antitoxin component of YhaV-PrlF toxin-antitoxin module